MTWISNRIRGENYVITVTLQWAESPASRLFAQPVFSGTDQSKRQSSASLTFVRGIHLWPVDFLYKEPVMQKMFPFDDVMMDMHSSIMR